MSHQLTSSRGVSVKLCYKKEERKNFSLEAMRRKKLKAIRRNLINSRSTSWVRTFSLKAFPKKSFYIKGNFSSASSLVTFFFLNMSEKNNFFKSIKSEKRKEEATENY